MSPDSSTTTCPCGQAQLSPGARFCPACGRATAPRQCACGAAIVSPTARFCHRCGQPVAGAAPAAAPVTARPAAVPAPGALAAPVLDGIDPARERRAWTVATAVGSVLLALVAWMVVRDQPGGGTPANASAPVPAEAPFAGGAAAGGTPPDISSMTPRERFDRLYDRIMRAAAAGDSATVLRFTPMAVQAYAMLDETDVDARYHAAVLHAQVGEFPQALALADTIQAAAPDHLFAPMVRAEVARLRGDDAALRAARRAFLQKYDAEMAQNRLEYVEHKVGLDEFRAEAQAAK